MKTEKFISTISILFITLINLSIYMSSTQERITSFQFDYPLQYIILVSILVFWFSYTIMLERYSSISISVIYYSIISLFLFPVISNTYYYGQGTDALTHVGYIRDLTRGNLSGNLIYPHSHILTTEISAISGLNILESTYMIPIIFYTLFTIFYYLISKSMFGGEFARATCIFYPFLLALAADYDVGGYIFFKPYFFSVLASVLILWYVYRIDSSRNNFLLLIFIIFITLTHALTGGLVLLTLSIYYILCRYSNHNGASKIVEKSHNTILLSYIVIVGWLIYVAQNTIGFTISRLFSLILDPEQFFSRSHRVQQIGIEPRILTEHYTSLEVLIQWHILKYGSLIAIGCITVFVSLIVINDLILNDKRYNDIKFALVWFWMIGTVGVLNGVLSVINVGIVRLFPLAAVPGGLILASSVCISKHIHKNHFKTLFIFIIFISAFTLYPSMITLQVNPEVTESETEGYEWVFEYSSESHLYHFQSMQHRFAHFIMGHDRATRVDYPSHLDQTHSILHLTDELERDTLSNNEMFIKTGYDRQYLGDAYPPNEYSHKFESIIHAQETEKVYNNGDTTLYIGRL